VIAGHSAFLLASALEMNIVFTDLDGTLLDHETYSWEAARPGIERLKLCNVPWVLVTSKTRAEVEWWRERLGNRHPFIVENGGAAFIPCGYFPWPLPTAAHRDNYEILEWGKSYGYLVARLKEASRRSRCRARGFHEMTAAEIRFTCDLPLEQAALAKLREYDEPFEVLDLNRTSQLLTAIEREGLRWTRGGRFWHITGENDKAQAVIALQRLYERAYGRIETIGLGDAVNDAPFLKIVDVPVLIHSPQSAKLKAAVPRGNVTERFGPAGWSEALIQLVPRATRQELNRQLV
jgi:mannosyl-3-phosphoglycerate phosphatase